MNRPTWATIVGVLGIIFGCTGILGSAQVAILPQIVDLQKEMFQAIEKQAQREEGRSQHRMDQKTREALQAQQEMFDVMTRMYRFPDWFRKAAPWIALVQAMVYGFYLFAAITLLQTKASGLRYMILALSLSIGFTITRAGITLATGSFMGIAMGFSGVLGIVIDAVLLIVVLTSDKTAFGYGSEPMHA